MFNVHERIGNFSKVVAMFETETEANNYLLDRLLDESDGMGGDNDEQNEELFYSMFSIEDDGLELITMETLIEMYDEMLDECYPEMFNLSPSIILYRADKIQYDCGLNDYYDSIRDEYYCEEME